MTTKFCALRSWLYIKMQIQEINIKNQAWNYLFGNLAKAKKLETKDVLIIKKNYKDLFY